MAHVTIFPISAAGMWGDDDAQLEVGDLPAPHSVFLGRIVLAFEDNDQTAAVTATMTMPANYTATDPRMDIHFFTESDATNDLVMEAFVEAYTPNTDNEDLETTSGWDTLNSGTISVNPYAAGDPLVLSITLSNDDGAVAGDLVRFGIRRETDAPDDISGDVYVTAIEFWDNT
ncbi:hypothetical protein LCGC14_1272440 [marine sediment metagenome]|uniref:Uncharacterized protein n=1 Tax=marine sediment metagenome TaxID=412755 RepID=A0A0F9P0N7_9ZZZZ